MSNQIEIRHLRYFLAVAEELHFRRAAEKLFVSQPGLSRQIKQMENELGVVLFERHNRKVVLTKAGAFLRDEVSLNLKNLDNIFRSTKLLDGGVEGNLRFGYVGSAMHEIIPNLMIDFSDKFPKVSFNLDEMDNNKQLVALMNQEIDLGFVRYRNIPSGLEEVTNYEDTFSLVLPKNHKIHIDNFKSLREFEDVPFILFDESYSVSYFEIIMSIFDDFGFKPIVSHKSVNANSIFRLVEKNFGISIIPTPLKLGYDMDVKFIELKDIKQRTSLRVIRNPNNQNPSLNNFIELLK